ncbi:hypothetical protein ABMA58_12975, partial [Oceanospirillum sp. HFRX-1_2]
TVNRSYQNLNRGHIALLNYPQKQLQKRSQYQSDNQPIYSAIIPIPIKNPKFLPHKGLLNLQEVKAESSGVPSSRKS